MCRSQANGGRRCTGGGVGSGIRPNEEAAEKADASKPVVVKTAASPDPVSTKQNKVANVKPDTGWASDVESLDVEDCPQCVRYPEVGLVPVVDEDNKIVEWVECLACGGDGYAS